MALRDCFECRTKISTSAKTCPKCGATQPIPTRPTVWIIGGLFAVVVIIGVANSIGPEEPRPAPRILTPEQKAEKYLADSKVAAAYACRDLIKKTLHDPESAQWDRPWFTEATIAANVWQVQVTGRAKNRLGAYALATYECKMRRDGDDWRLIGIKTL